MARLFYLKNLLEEVSEEKWVKYSHEISFFRIKIKMWQEGKFPVIHEVGMVYIRDCNHVIKLKIDIIFGVEFVNECFLTTSYKSSSTLARTQLTDTC